MTHARDPEPAPAERGSSSAPEAVPDEIRKVERVRMIRPDLVDLPECPLPPGFTLRGYQSGDRDRWLGIITATEQHLSVSPGQHLRAFGTDETRLARRQLFLVAPDGAEVGTSTAWFGSEPFAPDWGRVHWLAIRPRWQGRGLAKPLLGATLGRLRDLGHPRAYLVTESVRRPAIALYQKFGFIPDIRTPAEAAVWRAVLEGP
jgi:GNAT superfamily N-acetyltransferase